MARELRRVGWRVVGAAGRFVGVDVNPGMIDVAKRLPTPDGVTIDWQEGDATSLDLDDDAFDLVVCQQGLQFFSDRVAGAREWQRVLAPGGRAVVATWRGLDVHPLWKALAEAELPHLREIGVNVTGEDLVAPISLGSEDELQTVLEAAGFQEVEIVERSIEARFTTPERFVERLEYAYAAVIPQLAEDPGMFDRYLTSIMEETREIVAEYRRGDHVVVPMHTHIAVARC